MFESEYEVAATNASTTRFPWGNDSDRLEPWDYGPVRHPEYDTVHTGTKEVFGLFSNVGEWTMTPMSLYPTLEGKGYNLELSAEEYVVRGGDLGVLHGTKPSPSLATDGPKFRAFINKQEMHRGIGFRCARSRQPRLTRNAVEKIVSK